jgi:type II restriction/modification system DNA methylase subunit YeeA
METEQINHAKQQQDKYATNLTEQINTTNTDNEMKNLQNNVKEIKTEIQDLQNSVKEMNNKFKDLEFGIKQFIEMLTTPSYEDEDNDEYEGEDDEEDNGDL